MSPAVNAAVTDVIAVRGREVNSGAALAGFQMVGDVGAIIGPIVAGMIVERVGYFAAFATAPPLRPFPSSIGSACRCSDERPLSDLLHADSPSDDLSAIV